VQLATETCSGIWIDNIPQIGDYRVFARLKELAALNWHTSRMAY